MDIEKYLVNALESKFDAPDFIKLKCDDDAIRCGYHNPHQLVKLYRAKYPVSVGVITGLIGQCEECGRVFYNSPKLLKE